MQDLTPRQQAVLAFVESRQAEDGRPPTLAEIARHFRYRSINAAADHVRALKRKGWLAVVPRQARALRVLGPGRRRAALADIPLFGAIPAGFAREQRQAAEGCVAIDVETLGFQPTPRTFALEVRGDSMVGRHILEGDIVVLEHGLTPRAGDVVAALIDNESTLKTFLLHRGRPVLRAENPRYPDLIPATELVIQGVMVALLRRGRQSPGRP